MLYVNQNVKVDVNQQYKGLSNKKHIEYQNNLPKRLNSLCETPASNLMKVYYVGTNKPSFKGELETKFFLAVKEGNLSQQLAIINDISFDILARDPITGNNFLHVACIDGSQRYLEKALKLLRINRAQIEEVLNATNKDLKVPFDYLENDSFKIGTHSFIPSQDDSFKRIVLSIIPKEKTIKPTVEATDKNTANVITPLKELKGTGITDDAKVLNNKDMTNKGTTSRYDTYYPRTALSENDPKSLDDVIGMDAVKEEIILKVLAPLNPIVKKYYQDNKIPISGGIILYGPGGCGKTFLMKAVAAEAKRPIYQVWDFASSNANEIEKNMKKLFDQLRKKYRETGEPSILYFDEWDLLFSKNQDKRSINLRNALIKELRNADNEGIVFVCATDEKDISNSAIKNLYKFDAIKVDYPDQKTRIGLISDALKYPVLKHLVTETNIKKFAELTNGFSCASICNIFSSLKISKYSEAVANNVKSEEGLNEYLSTHPIKYDDVIESISDKKEEIIKWSQYQ